MRDSTNGVFASWARWKGSAQMLELGCQPRRIRPPAAAPVVVTEKNEEYQSEGFPERDLWFLGTMDQGFAEIQARKL